MGLRRFSPAYAVLLLCVLPLRASIPPVPTNTWQQGAALSTARTGATATLMADGRILIVGGKDGNGNALETAEVLNPDGTIAPVPSMLTQRYGHSAILLHDGNVLVAGGHTSGGGVVNSAELFDPVANTWRWASNTMADPRADFTLSQLIDGSILVAGGDNGSGPISGVEKFDLLTKAFKYIGSLNAARKAHAASVLNDGRVLITGGSAVVQDGSTIALTSTEIYDPNSTVLNAGPSLYVGRFAHSATTLIDGTVLLVGGNSGSADLASTEIYDPVANTMTLSSASLVTARSRHVALLLPNNNSVLIAGGTSSGADLSSTELYRSWNSAMLTNPPMSAARLGVAGSALQADGAALIAGGSNLGTTELYGFATVKTDKLDYAPGTPVQITGSGWTPGETVALTLLESPNVDQHPAMTAIADSLGNISNSDFAPDSHDLSIRFYLTAVGTQSQAQTTFTDGRVDTITTISASTPNPWVLGQVTFTISVKAGGTPISTQGCVQMIDNGTPLSAVYAVTSGTASAQITFSSTGQHGIQANYMDNGNTCGQIATGSDYKDSFSPILTQTVGNATPTITWATPSAITYGTALSPTQLSATATVPGTFTYTPAAGTVLNAGSNQTLSVHFVPTDTVNYTSADATVSINVQAKSVTPSITASNKVYDSTTAATFTCSLSGVLAADTASLTCTGGSGSFASAGVGTGITVTATGLTLSGSRATNYILSSGSSTTTANITSKPLTITGVTANDKVYDGSTTATLNASGAILQGIVGTDNVTLRSTTAVGTFADKNVGNGKAVISSGFSLLGTASTNYTVSQPTGLTASITAKALTVNGITANDKVYDGTRAVALNTSAATLVGVFASDAVTLSTSTATGTFADKVVGNGKTVTVSGLTISGSSSGNYSLSQPTTSASITPKPLTVTGVTAVSKIYDGTTSATLNTATASLVGVVSGDAVSLSSTSATGTFADKNVGTTKTVTIAGLAIGSTDAGNYTVSQPTATADITAKSLTPTVMVQNKVYDGTASGTIATQTLTGVLSPDVVSLVAGPATFSDKNIGVGKTVTVGALSLSGADAGNYSVSNSATATADITPRALHVTATGSSKVYDGNTVATVTLHDDRVSSDIFTDSNTSATFIDKNVGTAKTISVAGISIAGADSNNYSPVNATTSATADITTRGLTVSATADDKVYDGNATAIAHLSDNRVSGDTFAEAYTAASFPDKTVALGRTVSITGISISGGDAGNYNLSATTATTTASITARPLHVTATGQSRKYDGTTTATVTLSDDRLPADTLTDSYSSASFADRNVGTGKPVTVAGIFITGADAANYAANTTTTTTATITQRLVTISAVADAKIYDATVTSSAKPTLSGDGLVAGDTESSSQTFDTRNVGTGKTLTATGTIQDGNGGANYQVTFVASHGGSITPRPLTVSATGVSKQYDGLTAASVTLTDDRLTGDVFTDSYTGASFANKNVGVGKTISVAVISIAGADAGNYSPVNATATATADITPRALTVSAIGANKTYDGNTTATVQLTDDRLAGDSLTDSYGSATFDSKNVGSGKTVSVSGISVSGSDSGNYNLANTTAATTANISARHLTVTATGVDKTYDGTTTATVTLSDDRLSGDTLTEGYSSASFSDKNVGSGKTVTVTGIAISGADAANYSANPNTATTASISPRKLTVTAAGVAKVYDGTTLASVTLADDRVSGDLVTDADASATFSDKNVGTAKIVSVSGITISGIDAPNYSPINATATTTADIAPRSLTVSAIAVNRPYDGTTMASVTLNDNRVQGDALTDTFASATFSDRNVGIAKTVTVTGISTSGVDVGNYVLGNTTASTIADITARAIEVTGTSDSKTYDATAASSKSPSITLGSLAAGDNATYTQIFDSKNAGTRSLLPSIVIADGNNGHNYSVIFHNANGTISPLTIAGSITVMDKTYDGTISATIATRTLSGVLTNDVVSYMGGTATFSDSNAGIGKTVIAVGLYVAGTDAGNYAVSPTATTTATISKANQQISWSTPAPIVFGTSLGNTQLNAAVTGVQGGTAPGALTYTPAAGTILGVGTRQLRVDAASTINYNAATSTVSINVSYSTGACLGDLGHSILQPINADGSSTFKQGSTVPAKFRVCDAAGHSIGTAGLVTSFNLIQTISGTVSATVDDTVTSTTPDSSFRWDSAAQQWIFNVSTKPLSAQTTYVYSIGLNDGSTIFFRYGLPK